MSCRPTQTTYDGKPRGRHCFHVELQACDESKTCCGFELSKFELSINNNCKDLVRMVMLNGESVQWTFHSAWEG